MTNKKRKLIYASPETEDEIKEKTAEALEDRGKIRGLFEDLEQQGVRFREDGTVSFDQVFMKKTLRDQGVELGPNPSMKEVADKFSKLMAVKLEAGGTTLEFKMRNK